MSLQRGRHAGILRLEGGDHRLQNSGIVGEDIGVIRHADRYHVAPIIANKTRDFREIIYPTRAGGAPQSGRRQSIPSHSMAS